MNWVDLVVLGVILISGLLAFSRGLVREALGLGAWIAAAAAAIAVQPLVQPWARQQFSDQTLADTVALVAVFVVVLILLSLVASSVAGAVRDSPLGGLDRTLGLLFGLARGAVLVCAAYIVVGLAVAVDQWPPRFCQPVRCRSSIAALIGSCRMCQRIIAPRLRRPRAGRPRRRS